MSVLAAENLFRDGLMAMADGRYAAAADHFQSALRADQERGVASRSHVRSLSFFGLSSALGNRATPDAIRACERAVELDPTDADLLLNLARVQSLAGRRTRALRTIERGLRLSPSHRGLRREFAKLDRRSKPVVPFLNRSHPLNCALGRLRASLSKNAGADSRSPATAGARQAD